MDSLPILKKPRDVLRDGRESLAHEALPKHPVQRIQELKHKQEFESRVARVGQIYGSHASLRLQMERAILAQHQRLGLPSNFSGLDTMLGRDEEIGFEDVLSVDSPEKARVGMDALMRLRLL